VNATAGAEQVAVRQNDLKTSNVIAGNAVFEATWATRISGNVSTNCAMFEACRIGWIKELF